MITKKELTKIIFDEIKDKKIINNVEGREELSKIANKIISELTPKSEYKVSIGDLTAEQIQNREFPEIIIDEIIKVVE